jgi:phosphomannomutase
LLHLQRSGADLGIVFDTDVDRSAVVAANGEPINSNRYIGLMSYIALRWVCASRSAFKDLL